MLKLNIGESYLFEPRYFNKAIWEVSDTLYVKHSS